MSAPQWSPVDDLRGHEVFEAQQDAEFAAGHCTFCRRPVEPGRDYRRVHGWVGGPGRDGFVRDGFGEEWSHKHCIEVNKSVGMNQEALDV